MDTPVDSPERKTDNTEKDPTIRVVDRRWWARGETAATEEQAPPKPPQIEELEQRLHESGVQLQKVLSEHRRSVEEFEQSKARMRRDAAREVERGRRAVLVELLEVVDNLERAISAAREQSAQQPSEAVDKVTRGIELVRDQFLAKLTGFGVTRIDVLGQPFEATRHDAVSLAPVADAAQDGSIVAILKEGYAIGEEVLRPAAVIVGKYSV